MIKRNITKIEGFLTNNKISSIEKKRLWDDLEVVHERLSKWEYRMMDYSLKNKFNVPERTREFFLYLESYCLTWETWAKILNKLKVNSYNEVVDLCSWWAPKITLALFYSEYKWKMILFDKNKKSMSLLKKFMRLFNPKYEFENIEADILSYTWRQFPFIIANHVIDDLVLDLYCNKHGISTKTIYEKEWTVKALWDKIEEDKWFYVEMRDSLSDIFDKLLRNNWIICFAQYCSMMEWLLNLDNSVRYSKKMMYEIADKLNKSWYETLGEIPKKALSRFKWAFLPEECLILMKN